MLYKLKNDYEILARQAESTKKVITEVVILETKEKIAKSKAKIKQLKQKCRNMGDKIEKGYEPL